MNTELREELVWNKKRLEQQLKNLCDRVQCFNCGDGCETTADKVLAES